MKRNKKGVALAVKTHIDDEQNEELLASYSFKTVLYDTCTCT